MTVSETEIEKPLVRFDHIDKSFDGETLVIKDLNLDIAQGEFLTMLGPSGSGKTTTLMMLAGFETPTHGEIYFGGQTISNIPPHKRNIGMVFQDYSLFPHMTVKENLAFPLKVRKLTKDEIDGKVTKTVPFGAFVSVGEGVEGLVHVSEIAMHHVESPELELSIGQQVRVKVTEIDADRRRVSLSIKQALPEWEERSTWSDKPKERQPKRREFTREEDATPEPSFNADSSLEAILQELKERGIGRS